MKRLFIVFLLLGAALLAAPGIIGYQVEERFQQALGQVAASQVEVSEQSYQRGWFGSTAQLKLTVRIPGEKGEAEQSISVRLNSQISHGPLVSSGAGLAEITTTLSGDEPLPQDYTGNAHTLVEFSGEGVTRLDLPPLELDASADHPRMAFGGISGEVRFNAAMEALQSEFSMPQFQVMEGGDTPLQIGEVKLATQGDKSASGLMLGGGQLSMESLLVIDPAEGHRLELSQLSFEANSEEVSGLVSTQVNYQLQQLQADGNNYGPMTLSLELSRLPSSELLKIQQGMQEVNAQALDEAQRGMAVMSILMGSAPAMLKQDPKLVIDRLYAKTPEGDIQGALTIQAVGLSWAEIANPQSVLGKLVGEANIELPETLLLKLLEQRTMNQVAQQIQLRRQMGEEVELPDPDVLASTVKQQVQQQLEFWLQQQFAVREGGQIKTVVALSEGLLTVNGKTIPLLAQ